MRRTLSSIRSSRFTRGGVVLALALAGACSQAADDEGTTESSTALTGTVSLLPTSDVELSNVTGDGASTNLFGSVDDGTSFAAADNATNVRNKWASSKASYTAGYSGAPAGAIGNVSVNFRAVASSAPGSVQVELYDGTTLLGKGPVHTLTGSYSNYSDPFSALSVANANNLRTKLVFSRAATSGYLRVTQLWIDVTGTDAAPPRPTPDAGVDATPPPPPPDAGTGGGGGTGTADEIHWTFTGPTSVTFDWRGSGTTVRYGKTAAYSARVTGAAPNPMPYSSNGPFWEARLTGLEPDTVYHYSIGTSPDKTFRTMPARGAAGFTVFAEGDIGDSSSYANVTVVQDLIGQGKPAFVLGVGDLTYGNAHGQSHVDQHFNDVMAWSREAAYMPIWGNHEWDKSTDDLRNYKGRFDLPNPQSSPGAPALGGAGEDWYWFDYGNVRFIAFPEPFSGAWADWRTKANALMAQVDADPAIRHVVTFGHRPSYSSGHHPGNDTLKGYLDTLGAAHPKYVLDLVGHSHGYERSRPQSGVTHLVVGTGGASLEEDVSGSCLWLSGCPGPTWLAYRAMHLGATKLEFNASGIRGTFVCGPSGGGINDVTCALGTTLDSFTIGTP